MESVSDIVRRQLRLTDEGDLDGFLAGFDPDCEWQAPGAAARGRDAVRAYIEPLHRAFPTARHDYELTVAGDTAFVEGTWGGVHAGPLATPDGEIAATGKDVRFPFLGFVRVRDGRVYSLHVYFDQLAFLAQLGLVPEPAAA